jgi:hypothetical protein
MGDLLHARPHRCLPDPLDDIGRKRDACGEEVLDGVTAVGGGSILQLLHVISRERWPTVIHQDVRLP